MQTDIRQLNSCFSASAYVLFKDHMDLPKSQTTRLVTLVMKVWPTVSVPYAPRLGICLGTCGRNVSCNRS